MFPSSRTRLACLASAVACSLIALPGGAQDASPELANHMHSDLQMITALRTAVIRGDLDAARKRAQWIAQHEAPAAMPATGQGFVDDMRAAAGRAAQAADIDAIAAATADIATACGGCHAAEKVSDRFGSPDPYTEEESVSAHMARHQWSTEQMWQGMIGPSDWAWSRGVSLFVDVPLEAHLLSSDNAEHKRLEELANRVHERAAMGFVADTPEQRAEIFTEVVATCGRCHAAVGGGPRR